MKRWIVMALLFCSIQAKAVDPVFVGVASGIAVNTYFLGSKVLGFEDWEAAVLSLVATNLVMLIGISTSDSDARIRDKISGSAIGSAIAIPIGFLF